MHIFTQNVSSAVSNSASASMRDLPGRPASPDAGLIVGLTVLAVALVAVFSAGLVYLVKYRGKTAKDIGSNSGGDNPAYVNPETHEDHPTIVPINTLHSSS